MKDSGQSGRTATDAPVPPKGSITSGLLMTSAGSVVAARPASRQAGGGAIPTSALRQIKVEPVPVSVVRRLLVGQHYLHSQPGGTCLAFGIFVMDRLLGALTFGVGSFNAHSLVEGARRQDGLTLTRLWLDDRLPANSESRVLGVVLRALKRHTAVRFSLAYADPSEGHVGTVYAATNWLYIGLSEAMPLYDIGDGVVRHSRSLAHAYGTHSVRHFVAKGVDIRVMPRGRKHRFIFFLDRSWRARLRVPVLPYVRRELNDGDR